MGTAARTAVIAGTATAVVGGVSRSQQAKAQQAADAQAMPAAAPAAVADPAVADPAADAPAELLQLQKLASLHQQGILSAEEFSAKAVSILVP